MYKTETHMHVSEISHCGKLTAAEMVEIYHKAGYTTLIITDHFMKRYFENMQDKTPEERAEWFMGGYSAAAEAGKTYGMHILFGAEIHLSSSQNHYLVYGIDTAFLSRADLLDLTPQELYAYAKEKGVTMVQAHPYRDGNNAPTPDCVDALEVINHNPRHENYDEKVIEVARRYGLPMTSGSDAHRPEDVANSGVMTEKKITCIEDYVSALLERRLLLLGGENK